MNKYIISLLFIFLYGCAPGLDYKTLNNHMRADNCNAAADHVAKNESDYGSNMKLLFLLDSATVNMLCGNYDKSNGYFHKAEDLSEDLYTKSISKEAASFLVNDYTKPYEGEDFEKALINLFSAINYLMLGQTDEALVECRRLDANLSLFNDKYEQKNIYKEDAFGRYLSGIIYESVGKMDDAFIDYYKAFRTFQDYQLQYGTPMPGTLIKDLFRAAQATNRKEEIKSLRDEYGNVSWVRHDDAKELGRVVLIHFNGLSPVKVEDKIILPFEEGPITLAFPKYVVSFPYCRDGELVLESSSQKIRTRTELAEDINRIAVKNLDDRKGRVIAKTLARAVTKQVAIKKISKDENVRKLLNVANIFIERADTRTWRTLPGEVYITGVYVPPGSYNAFSGSCGREVKIRSFDIKAGETKFLFHETMY